MQPRRLNERISLRPKDKIPYGYYAAYHLLPTLFPHADIKMDRAEPMHWSNIDMDKGNQAVILSCAYFSPDELELKHLASFARKGNYVFIITPSISYDVNKFFGLSSSYFAENEGFKNDDYDSLAVALESPPFATRQKYIYPGRRMSYAATLQDSAHGIILGRNNIGRPNFLYFKAGEGSVSIHLSPLAFSNYFILHKNNIQYYQQALSVIPQNVTAINWNEYYLFNGNKNEEPNFLKVLFRYPPFKWALLTAAATILLFALLYMRRRQRMIPAMQKPNNESLDFIKTIGRLYHDKKDHTNLAQKMSAYFLDHVRQRYLMSTNSLDDEFVATLHGKTGYDINALNEIVIFIKYVQGNVAITEYQLANFHKQLENFYQNS